MEYAKSEAVRVKFVTEIVISCTVVFFCGIAPCTARLSNVYENRQRVRME
jgi:hypothetical protein